jgi:hypothetical protein
MKEKENETSIKRSGVKLNTVIKKEVIQFENVVTQLKIFVKYGLRLSNSIVECFTYPSFILLTFFFQCRNGRAKEKKP